VARLNITSDGRVVVTISRRNPWSLLQVAFDTARFTSIGRPRRRVLGSR
jgi:hypothetical protein